MVISITYDETICRADTGVFYVIEWDTGVSESWLSGHCEDENITASQAF